MKHSILFIACAFFLFSCGKKTTFNPRNISKVEIIEIYQDSVLSIRAIDILNDGSLDYNETVRASFDFVIASVHSNLKMDEKDFGIGAQILHDLGITK